MTTDYRFPVLDTGRLLEHAQRHAESLNPLCEADHPAGILQLDRPSNRLVGNVLGITASAVTKLRRRGVVSIWTADRYATRLGVHPCLIWGDDWWTDTCLEDGAA
jgi:hypothetical protein